MKLNWMTPTMSFNKLNLKFKKMRLYQSGLTKIMVNM